MASELGIRETSHALAELLTAGFAEVPGATAIVARGDECPRLPRPSVSVLLYHAVPVHAANGRPIRAGRTRAPGPGALELRYLLTPWADDAMTEQALLECALVALGASPVAPLASGAAVRFLVDATTPEVMASLGASLGASWRASVVCLARVTTGAA